MRAVLAVCCLILSTPAVGQDRAPPEVVVPAVTEVDFVDGLAIGADLVGPLIIDFLEPPSQTFGVLAPARDDFEAEMFASVREVL